MISFSKKDLVEVSKLYYYDNYTQEQIASSFFTSRSTISRALTEARKQGLVQVIIPEIGYDTREVEENLKAVFSLKHVLVVPIPLEDEASAFQITIEKSAQFVSQFFKNGDTIGMAWGRTIYEITRNLPSLALPDSRVVQLLGNVDSGNVRSYAYDIIQSISLRLGTKQAYTVTSPIMTENKMIKDLLLYDSRIKSILEMGSSCNKMFVNLATANHDSCLFRSGYLSNSDLTTLKEANAVGSICGHFLDSNGDLCDSQLDQRTIGVELQDIRNAEIVFACVTDISKLKILHASLSKKYINVLMVDYITANKLISYHQQITTKHIILSNE